MLKYSSFPLALSLILIATPAALSLENNPPAETQTQQQPPLDPNRAAAEKAEAEASQLQEQKAPLSQQIAKYEEALKYRRLAGDRPNEVNNLHMLSMLYARRGEYRKGLDYAQQSLSIIEALGDRGSLDQKVSAISNIARIYSSLGESEKAIDYYQQAISLAYDPKPLSPADNPKLIAILRESIFWMPTFLDGIAGSYEKLGETQKALDTYKQELVFWKKKGEVMPQVTVLLKIAMFYMVLGEVNKSIDTLKQANTLDPDFKRWDMDMGTTRLIRFVLEQLSCVDKLASLKKPPDLDKAESSSNQSATFNGLESINNDIEAVKKLVQKEHSEEHPQLEAAYLGYIGGLEFQKGEFQETLKVYQQALELNRMIGAKLTEAQVLTEIADILDWQGKEQEAINTLNQALDIQRQLKNRPGEASTLLTLGNIYKTLRAYPRSLDAYKSALSLSRFIGDRDNETTALGNIGYVYQKSEDYPQALQYYQQALSVSRTAGNCLNEVSSLQSISEAYLDLGNYQKAITAGNEALDLSRNLGDIQVKLAGESRINRILAKVEIKRGNYAKALELTEKAQKQVRDSGFRLLERVMVATIAETYEAAKQPEKAIATYQEELTLNRRIGLQHETAQSLYNIARLQRQTKHYPEALKQINEAISIVETIRKEVASPELRTQFFASKQDYYQLKIDILMELHQQNPSQGYDRQAFDTSESSRARTLLELLNEAKADIRQGVDPTLLEQEKDLQNQLAALDRRWSEFINKNPTEAQKNTFEQDRKTLLNQYQDIQAQIRVKSPKYAALTQPQPLTLEQVQQQVLDEDTVLLQYSLGKERSYLWIVTKEGRTSYQLPAQAEIEKRATNLLQQIKQGNQESFAQAEALLNQVILAPAKDKLTKKRLLIVADGVLQYIPFSALSLSENQQPLITQYEIVNAPSSSSLAIIRNEIKARKPAPKALAILADPIFSADDERVKNHQSIPSNPNNLNLIALETSVRSISSDNTLSRLPGTRQEANAILNLIPDTEKTSAFDDQANLTLANNPQLSQYRIVHFATHGIFNEKSPELSGIVLSLVDQKGNSLHGFLGLSDIFNLNLPTELVVLSACETGLGKQIKGEGLVGLTRGFMYAGSPRLLVSLWKVDDKATAEFMTRFYKLILEKKLPPAEALREAQLEMQRETEWKSPYYWAAFVLQGEWQ